MSTSRITYGSRPDVTPEAERDALANVYRYILDCHATKKFLCSDHRDDAHERTGSVLIHDEGRSA